MTEEQNAGKILLFCKEPSPEQIMKCLRDAFDVPGSVHDADLKLHNGDLDVTIRVYCESGRRRTGACPWLVRPVAWAFFQS